MSLFKKPEKKPEPKQTVIQVQYPIEIRSWSIHRDAIIELLKSAEIDLNAPQVKSYFNCRLVPDKDNAADKNALKVMAAPTGRGKEYFDIGYVPAESALLLRSENTKVTAKTHYWSLRMYYDVLQGVSFSLYLNESKFK